jgi:hypothetical protein
MPRSALTSALIGLLALPLAAVSALVATAQAVPARPSATIESVLSQAKAATEGRDFQAAYRLLSGAYQAQPQPLLLHGLALLAAAEDRTVEAQDLWRRFLADPSLDARATERGLAQSRLLALPLIAAGEVSVGASRGALVELDGRVVGVAPLSAPLLVRTGRHRVAVTLGRWRAETEVAVRTARLSELRFKEGADVVVASQPAAVLYVDAASGLAGGAASGQAPGASETTGSPLLDPLLDPLAQAAAAALTRESYVLLPQRLAVAYDSEGGACPAGPATIDTCLKALAGRYGVDSILRSAISREGQTLRIEVTLLDLQVDDVAASASATCVGCASEQVASKLADTVTQVLTTGGGRVRGTLSAVSEPAGGELRVGTRVLGLTPLSHKLWAGSYEITISRPGHQPYVQQIDVKSEETTRIEAALVPLSSTPATQAAAGPVAGRGRSRSNLIFWAAGGAGVAVGATLLGFGASALFANGSCAMTGLSDPSLCRRVYDTAVPGGVMTAVGGALIIGGGVALILPLVRKPK